MLFVNLRQNEAGGIETFPLFCLIFLDLIEKQTKKT